MIFDLMEKFAGYGFNKSHSAAYALLSYQTAWLKAHYPAAFMAAVLSSDMDKTDKVVTLIDECASMKLTVHPPGRQRIGLRVSRSRVPAPSATAWARSRAWAQSAVQAIVEERDGPRSLREPPRFVPAHRSATRQQARVRGADPAPARWTL